MYSQPKLKDEDWKRNGKEEEMMGRGRERGGGREEKGILEEEKIGKRRKREGEQKERRV